MNFTCKTQNFKEAIMKVERIVSKQTNLPILSNVLIKTEKGRISITATNLEIAVKSFLGAKIEKEGEITIPAKVLGGFISNIKDETIQVELSDSILKIKSDKHTFRINGIKSNDFPIIPKNPEKYFFKIKNEKIINIINGILISIGKSDARQELNGVFMQFSENKITLATTDSFRLSEGVFELEKENISDEYFDFIKKNPSIIVPAMVFSEIQRIIPIEDEIFFTIKENQLFIKNTNFRLVSRLINGDYPEYQQILPKKYDIEIKTNKDEFINSLKIASLVLGDLDGEVLIKNSKNKKDLIISSQAQTTGDNISKMDSEIIGDDLEVVFNCRYLQDGLSIFSEKNIILKLKKEKSPVLIKAVNEKGGEINNLSYILMPIVKE